MVCSSVTLIASQAFSSINRRPNKLMTEHMQWQIGLIFYLYFFFFFLICIEQRYAQNDRLTLGKRRVVHSYFCL